MIHRYGLIGWTAVILVGLIGGQPVTTMLLVAAIGYALLFSPSLLAMRKGSNPRRPRDPTSSRTQTEATYRGGLQNALQHGDLERAARILAMAAADGVALDDPVAD